MMIGMMEMTTNRTRPPHRPGSSVDFNGNGLPDERECLGDFTADGTIGFEDALSALQLGKPECRPQWQQHHRFPRPAGTSVSVGSVLTQGEPHIHT